MLPSFSEAFADEKHSSFQWDGDGQQAALLVHGFPGTPDEMRPIATVLHEMGWTVRAILLPGFGQDIDTILERSHDDWIAAVRHDLSALRTNHETVILVGFSMGGAVSINVAAEQNIDGLILFAPLYEVGHILWSALPVIKLFLPKIKIFHLFKPNFNDPETREGIQKFMPDADLDDPQVQDAILDFEVPISMFNEIRSIGQKGYQVAKKITYPVQVFQGIQDELVLPKKTRTLIKQFGGQIDYVEVNAPHEMLNSELDDWYIIVHHVKTYLEQVLGLKV